MFIDVRPRLANLRAGMEVNAGGISRLLNTVSPLMFRVTVVFEPSGSMSAGLFFNALMRVLPRLSWKMVPGGKALGLVVFRSAGGMVTVLSSVQRANAQGPRVLTAAGMLRDVRFSRPAGRVKEGISVIDSEMRRVLPMMVPA